MREQFQSKLDSELRVWLIDQKPKNLSEAARLADQYVAVRKADRPMYKGHDFFQKVMLLSQSHLENQGVVTRVGASRNQLRLTTMLSFTLSRSPQLLQLDSNSPSVKKTWHLEYIIIVRNLGTSCLLASSGMLSVSRKMPQCSWFLPSSL